MRLFAQTKPFNFVRSFSLLSFLSITLITVISAVLLSRFLTQNMLIRDATITMQFVQSIALINDPSGYFVHQSARMQNGAVGDASSEADFVASKAILEEFFAHIVAIPEVVRANVFDVNRQVIWSNQQHLIGKQFQDNPELDEALAGELAIETGVVNQQRKAEHIEFEQEVSRFVENYIPIWNTAGDQVIGVVEVYRVPHALFRSIGRGNRLVWTSTLLGGLFLYGSLFWIVRRAAQLIQRQQTQLVESETMAAVGEMSSSLAHNLRNPLASIRSSAELAIEEESAPVLRESAVDIVNAVDRLDQRVRELFTYTQPLQAALQRVHIDALINNTLSHFQPDMALQNVKLELKLEEGLPALQADAGLLEQACHSLIANALEAMPDGGDLTISAQLTVDRRGIQLGIHDTGIGIAVDQLENVFKPFFTTKPKGLGVGLSLVKRIVERHHGSIEITSREGRGATVSLLIPLSE
jgi:two-component system sensor histidine kinase HydH